MRPYGPGGRRLTPAWFEGDGNGDGVFDHEEIVAVLQTGNYLQGPYAAVDAAITDQEN